MYELDDTAPFNTNFISLSLIFHCVSEGPVYHTDILKLALRSCLGVVVRF